jgi:hypothetical protein
MKKKTTWEVRFWHGFGKTGYERWIISTEPEFLSNGTLKFVCGDGLERHISGTIEIVKRAVEPK